MKKILFLLFLLFITSCGNHGTEISNIDEDKIKINEYSELNDTQTETIIDKLEIDNNKTNDAQQTDTQE